MNDIPDISFYQDDNTTARKIDFAKMATRTSEVIIRAGQRSWVDEDFIHNWGAAKQAGLLRGSYWFYDSRETPQKQADIWKVSIGSDLPERGLWIDLEESYNGAYKGEANWKRFTQAVSAYFPFVIIGIYTANWWWSQQSVSQHAYWSSFPLWVAEYGVANPTIPFPWRSSGYVLHQYTSKGDGPSYGVESLNIDLNRPTPKWYNLFGGAPIPPPDGGTMEYGKVKTFTNIRTSPPGGSYQDIGDLLAGDEVIASEIRNVNGYDWWRLSAIKRAGVAVALPAVECWAYGVNIEKIAPPARKITKLDINLTAGSTVTTHYSDGTSETETA